MNEVEIPIKVSGIGAIKAELRELKGQIADATDPAEMAALAMKAGELSDKLKDANEQVAVFAVGSKFEAVSNSLSGIKGDLMNLDFEGASEKAKTFSKVLGSVNPKELASGFGNLTKTLGTMGSAFVKLGIQILMNPIFLIVAAVVAIVAAVGFFLDKIGVLQIALDYLMMPINAAIAGLKMLGDFLGVTDYEGDERRKKEEKRAKEVEAQAVATMERYDESRKKQREAFNEKDKAAGREIELLKANGKETYKLELARLEAAYQFQRGESDSYTLQLMNLEVAQKKRKEALEMFKLEQPEVFAMIKGQEELNKLTANETKLREGATVAYEKVKDILHQAELLKINHRKEGAKDAAKENKNLKDKTTNIIDHEANTLEIQRKTRAQNISLMADGIKKEIAMINDKYLIQREDLVKNTKYSAKEKAKIQAVYDTQETIDKDAKQEANRILVEKNAKESEVGLIALRLESMANGEAKELAVQADKYQKLREAAIADTKLTAEQLQEKLNIYNALEIAEDAKRAKTKSDAAAALYFEITATEDQKKIAELNAKYATEQELANGNQVILQELQTQHEAALTQIEKDASLKRIEDAAAERDAKLTLANDITKGITDIGGMLIKDQEKLAKFNKASALVQIGIDTAKAISALVAASQSNALNGVTAGAAGIAQFASGIIQIATNIAKAKQLLTAPSTPVSAGGGGGGGGGASGGGGGNTASMIPQAAQLFGQGNNANTVNAGGVSSSSGGNMMVTAVVSETQITSVQKKINMINKNAEL